MPLSLLKYLRRLWSPGIAGSVLLAVEVLATFKAGERPLAGFSRLAFWTFPLVTVLCVGAIAEVVLARRSETTAPRRSSILQWIDVILGSIGVCAVASFCLVADPLSSSVSDRIVYLVLFLVIGWLGYVLFVEWKALTLFKRLAFVAAWIIAIFASYGALLVSMSPGEIPSSNRDMIVNDLRNLSAYCYQYRLRPSSMGGGNDSYVGYVIPKGLASRENISYDIVGISADTLVIRCTESASGGTVTVRLDSSGRLTDWNFRGKLDPWDDDWRVQVWKKWFAQ